MEAIENAWNNASRNPVELFSDMMIDLTGWGGAATILTTAILGRMAYNVATGGSIKKAGPVEAVGWTFGQIWDGAKWVFTGSRT